MIKEHTFFLENVSSCIDLILTNPVKMVVELVVHHSPHHHQIIVTKFKSKILHLVKDQILSTPKQRLILFRK